MKMTSSTKKQGAMGTAAAKAETKLKAPVLRMGRTTTRMEALIQGQAPILATGQVQVRHQTQQMLSEGLTNASCLMDTIQRRRRSELR